MKSFILRTIVTGFSLLAADWLLDGVELDGAAAIVGSALILGLVNAFVRPVLVLLTLPITLLSLGLFLFVVNAITYGLTAYIVPGFEVSGLMAALLGALVTSLVSWLIYSFFKKDRG
jgi:putative membrane protein